MSQKLSTFDHDNLGKMENEEMFKTFDLGLCAALLAAGQDLIDIDKSLGKRALFLFRSTEKNAGLVQKYWDECLPIDALTYFNAIKNIKNRLYSR